MQELLPRHGYDVILTAETIYNVQSLPRLYALIKHCLEPVHGVWYQPTNQPTYLPTYLLVPLFYSNPPQLTTLGRALVMWRQRVITFRWAVDADSSRRWSRRTASSTSR